MTLTPGMLDYDLRVRRMDQAGVDRAIVSLTCPNVFWGSGDESGGRAGDQ
jgi:aminocarboxymuconate-semialdehyde decarboxylase